MSLPPPPKLTLNPRQSTAAMTASLEELRSSLLCPLCNQILVEPSTLSCGHNFCLVCIEDYTCNAWNCPVPSCGMPVSVRGGRDGSYRKINPQISTVVTSFDTICRALGNAPLEWWKSPMPESCVPRGPDEEEEQTEEIIDLQADKENESVCLQEDSPSPSVRTSRSNKQNDTAFGEERYYHSPSSPRSARKEQSSESQDSQKTLPFSMLEPPSSSDSSGLLEPSMRKKSASRNMGTNISCFLPSQSPGFSPIIERMESQEPLSTIHPNSNNKKMESLPPLLPRKLSPARTQRTQTRTQNPAHRNLANSKPRILLVSPIIASDKAIVEELVDQNRLTLLLDSMEDEINVEDDLSMAEFMSRLQQDPVDTVAICGTAEFATGDGYLVERTFGYLLAVACEIQVAYSSSLQLENGNKRTKKSKTVFPSNWSVSSISKHQIIGDVLATKMNAPQRALQSRIERNKIDNHTRNNSILPVGTLLLQGHTLLLCGDFDVVTPQRSRLGTGRKRPCVDSSGSSTTSNNLYSKRRFECLLQLCGARFYDFASYVKEHSNPDTGVGDETQHSRTSIQKLLSDNSEKVAVLLRPNPKARDWHMVEKLITNCAATSDVKDKLCVTSGNWLLDSISDFGVKEFAQYTQPVTSKCR